MNIQNIYKIIKRGGLRSTLKSVYYSLVLTGRPTTLLCHRNVIFDVSLSSEFDINNRIILGLGESGATHPRIGRSKISTTGESIVSHTGTKAARIGPDSVIHIEGKFTMGDSYINSSSRIICGEEINIGNGCAIAWNFEAIDDDRHQITIDGTESNKTEPIEIKDNVWIGHDVSIHKGVTIHEGSIVASDSVVVSDVPARSLVVGSPARIVSENVSWE